MKSKNVRNNERRTLSLEGPDCTYSKSRISRIHEDREIFLIENST